MLDASKRAGIEPLHQEHPERAVRESAVVERESVNQTDDEAEGCHAPRQD